LSLGSFCVDKYQFWGRVTLLDSSNQLSVGQVIRKSYFEEKESSPERPSNECVRGKVISIAGDEITVVFSPHSLGWNYSWKSHKRTSLTSHCFKVFCCYLRNGLLRVQQIYCSPSFVVYSRNAPGIQTESAIKKYPREESEYLISQGASASHATMRTLDRLHLYFISVEDIYAFLSQSGLDAQETFNQNLIERLEKVKENFVSIMRDNRETEDCIAKWLSSDLPPGSLKEKCRVELDTPFLWSEMMEDEPFDEINGTETSIFSDFRQIYRNKTRLALGFENEEVSNFQELMCDMSAKGFFPMDPFRPPSSDVALMVRTQLHSSYVDSDYSIDLATFKDRSSHEAYAHDLLLLRRLTYQSIVYSRMHASQPECRKPAPAADPRIDMSGVWVDGDLANEINPNFPGLLGCVLSSTTSKALKQLYSRMHIEMTGISFVGRAQTSIVGVEFIFDSEVHTIPRPFVPFADTISCLFGTENPKYISYLEMMQDDSGSVIAARDYDIHPKGDFVRSTYPDFFAREPRSIYKWIGFLEIRYDRKSPNVCQYNFVDYLVHTDFEMTIDSIKQLRKESRYLVSRQLNNYFRQMIESPEEQESIWKLLT